MITRILLLCTLSLCSVHAACGQDTSPVTPAPALPTADSLRATIEQSRIAWDVPGLSVAVVHQGQVVLSAGFGLRELGQPEPVDGSTVFAI
ncbi:MAG: serine hydrolase, partial [Planctomycetaceae bacterium]